MIESLYNAALFVLAIWGAIRAGMWITNRPGWAWYWKVLAALVIAATIGGFAQQLEGTGPKSDLRIVTEILASAGCVFAAEFAFRHVADHRWRAVFVVLAGGFLLITWSSTIDRVLGTAKTIVPATPTTPAPAAHSAPSTSTRSQSGVDPLCDDPRVPVHQRQILGCPN